MHPFSYIILRSSRKTAAIQIKNDGTVLIRCPKFMKSADIDKLIADKSHWIQLHLQALEQKQPLPCFTSAEMDALMKQAKSYIPQRVHILAETMGISYHHVTVRAQRTRWGSCSSKGNLNFNCLLMLAPPEVLDYVIIHELCHRLEMNHSPAFWKKVAMYQPAYMHHRTWLKTEGSKLIQRLPK